MSRIGILSDTHGRGETAQRAVQLLVEAKVSLLIHLGDVGALEVIDALLVVDPVAASTAPRGGRLPEIESHLVFGNVDWDAATMAQYAREVGVHVHHPVGEIMAAGKRIVFTHGHDDRAMAEALDREPDYLLHGHTHEMRDERLGSMRVINPGALFRAPKHTAAVLDPAADEVTFLEVPRSASRR